MKQRIGRFKTTRELLFSDAAADVFTLAKLVWVKIEWDHTGIVTYTALSELFDPIEEGEVPPLYDMVLSSVSGRVNSVKACRQ